MVGRTTLMRILDAFRRRENKPKHVVFVAMIALTTPQWPGAKELTKALHQYGPDMPETADVEEANESMTFNIGPAIGSVMLISAPIPQGDIDAACTASAITWPVARQELQKHTAHLICSIVGPVEKKTAAYYLTKLVAATAKTVPAVGIYWGAAGMVHATVPFIEQAEGMSTEYLPLYLWINFALAGEDHKFSLRTFGMASLGFMEIEIVDSPKPVEEIVNMAFNVAHYLLDNGPVLADGDTFGFTESQKLKIRHVQSIVKPDEKIYRLYF